MRFPRFTLRTALLLVPVFAVASLAARALWWGPGTPPYRNPFANKTLEAKVATAPLGVIPWVAGQTVPITIEYDYSLGPQKPAKGVGSVLLAEVWFEDLATGRYVAGTQFDATLTTGGREATADTVTWNATIPRPGNFSLHYVLSHMIPNGRRTQVDRGRTYSFTAPQPGPTAKVTP